MLHVMPHVINAALCPNFLARIGVCLDVQDSSSAKASKMRATALSVRTAFGGVGRAVPVSAIRRQVGATVIPHRPHSLDRSAYPKP